MSQPNLQAIAPLGRVGECDRESLVNGKIVADLRNESFFNRIKIGFYVST